MHQNATDEDDDDDDDIIVPRMSRPHVELTHDLPLEGLVSEVKAIKDSIQMLEDKLDNARCVTNTMVCTTFIPLLPRARGHTTRPCGGTKR